MADTVPASEFTRNFGRYRMLAQREAVAVSSHGSITGYFVAPDEYEEFRAAVRRFGSQGRRCSHQASRKRDAHKYESARGPARVTVGPGCRADSSDRPEAL